MAFVALLCSLQPTGDEQTPLEKGPGKTLFQEVQTACTLFEEHMHLCMHHTSPFVYALLRNERQHLTLRITALGEARLSSIPSLLHALTLHPVFHLGNHDYLCQATDLSHAAWTGLSTWADFLAEPYAYSIHFSLGTPLVLSETGVAARGQMTHFPSPRSLFPLLAKRWHLLGGPPLPTEVEPLLEDGSIVLADYHLHSEQIPLDGYDPMGFCGWLSYECRTKNSSACKTLTALARFAFFAGIGALTQVGMGTTQVSLRR